MQRQPRSQHHQQRSPLIVQCFVAERAIEELLLVVQTVEGTLFPLVDSLDSCQQKQHQIARYFAHRALGPIASCSDLKAFETARTFDFVGHRVLRFVAELCFGARPPV